MPSTPQVSPIEFEQLVEEAIKSLPREFAQKMENVGVVIEDMPSIQQMQNLGLAPNSLLFGLYQGIPKTKRVNYSAVLPDKITIFKIPILMVCKTEEDVREKVRSTVIHEIGHHFGLSDAEMR